MRNPTGAMPGTTAGIPDDLTARLTRLGEGASDWAPLLDLVRETLTALGDGVGDRLLTGFSSGSETRDRPTPALHRGTLLLSEAVLDQWLRRLTALGSVSREGIPALLEGAIRETSLPGDGSRLLRVATRYAVTPILQAAANRVRVSGETWDAGYCPICGGWPILAEVRGLEQTRLLRCGRCGAEWGFELLRCSFCGERDHERLGSLVPSEGRVKAETCSSCHSLLKTLPTLLPLSLGELLVTDLETVELDLAALEHGFERPGGLGFSIEIGLQVS